MARPAKQQPAKIDWKKPYAQVIGDTVERFAQDGKVFDFEGNEVIKAKNDVDA